MRVARKVPKIKVPNRMETVVQIRYIKFSYWEKSLVDDPLTKLFYWKVVQCRVNFVEKTKPVPT